MTTELPPGWWPAAVGGPDALRRAHAAFAFGADQAVPFAYTVVAWDNRSVADALTEIAQYKSDPRCIRVAVVRNTGGDSCEVLFHEEKDDDGEWMRTEAPSPLWDY